MNVADKIKSGLPMKKADDLFEKSTMSFGAHLEELRKCLIYALSWLAIGVAVGLFFAKSVVNYVQTPLERALSEYYTKKSEKLVETRSQGRLTQDFKDFLIENNLVATLVYMSPTQLVSPEVAEVAAASDIKEPVNASTAKTAVSAKAVVSSELADVQEEVVKVEPENEKLKTEKYLTPALDSLKPQWLIQSTPANTDALGLSEPMMIWLKAGFVVGIVLASPGIFYSLWNFVAAGLYPHERKYVYFFLPFAVFLFLSGAALAFFVIFELVIRFLLTFNDSLGIGASPRLTDYMSFALFLPIGFGVAFQLPLVMFVIERIGLISVDTYLSQWRIAVLVITFISMVLTPAEVTSMIGMGVPLIGLYYLGIALCKYFPRRGFQAEPGYDPT